MPVLKRLGFILVPHAKPDSELVRGCIANFETGHQDVWKAYPCGQNTFVHHLFVASELAHRRLLSPDLVSGSSRNSSMRILITREDVVYSWLINYFFDVHTQKNKYMSVPPELRALISGTFSTKSGKQHLLMPTAWTASQFFFWTEKDYEQHVVPGKLPSEPEGSHVTVNKAHIISSLALDLHTLTACAHHVQLIVMPKGRSWQHLYKNCAIEDMYDPDSREWITIAGQEARAPGIDRSKGSPDYGGRERTPLEFTGGPRNLLNIVEEHKHVLLTGPAGSGKTTALFLLASSFIQKAKRSTKKTKLPLYVMLRSLERLIGNGEVSNMWQLVGWLVSATLKRSYTPEQLENCESIRGRCPNRR